METFDARVGNGFATLHLHPRRVTMPRTPCPITTKPDTGPGFVVASSWGVQSPTTRSPNTSDALLTYWALPLMFKRIVVGLAKKSSACDGVKP